MLFGDRPAVTYLIILMKKCGLVEFYYIIEVYIGQGVVEHTYCFPERGLTNTSIAVGPWWVMRGIVSTGVEGRPEF